eukprot:UN21326
MMAMTIHKQDLKRPEKKLTSNPSARHEGHQGSIKTLHHQLRQKVQPTLSRRQWSIANCWILAITV